MKLAEKLEAAYLERTPVDLNYDDVVALHGILDNLKDVIDEICPDTRPSSLSRQAAAEVKKRLIEDAKLAGFTWEQDDCGGDHEPFLVSRANKRKCLLCDLEHPREVLIEVKMPVDDDDPPIVAV